MAAYLRKSLLTSARTRTKSASHFSLGAASASATEEAMSAAPSLAVDPLYPGTAVERTLAARERARGLPCSKLDGDWSSVCRPALLWAGGLRDLRTAAPGKGYTGHSFSDFNHCDLTCMREDASTRVNDGRVRGIALGNQLGPGVKVASLPELGPGGSWSTCLINCSTEPPSDVAHVQFRSRIAFKLVWSPADEFRSFVLIDDAGELLAKGTPIGNLPRFAERELNFRSCQGSKYAVAAESL